MKRKRRPVIIETSSSTSEISVDSNSSNSERIQSDVDSIEEVGGERQVSNKPSLQSRLEKSKLQESNLMLIDKYPPETCSELAIHKKKVDQVKVWIQEAVNQSKPKILILTGPVGSGKTATVHCIANDLDLSLKEWENGIQVNSTLDDDFMGQDESLSDRFASAISSCCVDLKLTVKPVKNTSGNNSNNGNREKKKRVYLIEDVPNLAILKSASVQKAFQRYTSSSIVACPIVIIMSDVVHPYSSRRNQLDQPFTKRNFLPSNILGNRNVTLEISFNAIAKTILVKGLSRICSLEKGNNSDYKAPSLKELNEIAIKCDGDIRKAIFFMEFHYLSGDGQDGAELTLNHDTTTNLFHVLGKILYNKRKDDIPQAEYQLNGSLESKRKRELAFDPEQLFDQLQMEHSSFSLFLNQNYTNHCQTIQEAASIAEYLSISDELSSWDQSGLNGKYASSVAIRGTMSSWDSSINEEKVHRGFQAFAKTGYWDSERKRQENSSNWSQMARETRLRVYQDSILSFSESNRVALCEVLPFLGILNRFPVTKSLSLQLDECQFIAEICNYSLSANLKYFRENESDSIEDSSVPVVEEPAREKNLVFETESMKFLKKLKMLEQLGDILVDDDIE